MAGQTITVSVLADTAKFKKGMDSLGGVSKGILAGMAGIAVGVGAWVGSTVKDMARIERLGANTDAVIKATGGAAGKSAQDIANYADSFEKLTGLEAETVTEGQNVLLTFKNIKGANFDRATSSAADLAVWMNKGSLEGANMTSAANMMGKALDNPTKGITALTRVGVSFTDQEKEQIKALQAKGDMAGAQAMILKAVNGQVAGSAEAAGKTTEGMWAKVVNALGTVSEGILADAMPALQGMADWFLNDGVPAIQGFGDWIKGNVMPVLTDLGNFITGTIVPALQGFGDWIMKNKDWLIAVGTAIAVVAGAFIAWSAAIGIWQAITTAATAVQAAFNLVMSANPIALIVLAIAALVAGLVYFFTQTTAGKAAWAAFTSFISSAWNATAAFLSGTWDAIKGAFANGVNAVKGFLNGVWNFIKTVWNWSPYGLIINNWGKILGFFQSIPGKIKGWFGNAVTWLKSAGGNVVEGLWRGISDGYTWIKGKISGWVGNVIDFFKNLLGIHSPSTVMAEMGKFMVQGLAQGINRNARIATAAMGSLGNSMSLDFAGDVGGYGSRNYQITVQAGVGDPVEIGRQTVKAIRAYEQVGGRR